MFPYFGAALDLLDLIDGGRGVERRRAVVRLDVHRGRPLDQVALVERVDLVVDVLLQAGLDLRGIGDVGVDDREVDLLAGDAARVVDLGGGERDAVLHLLAVGRQRAGEREGGTDREFAGGAAAVALGARQLGYGQHACCEPGGACCSEQSAARERASLARRRVQAVLHVSPPACCSQFLPRRGSRGSADHTHLLTSPVVR